MLVLKICIFFLCEIYLGLFLSHMMNERNRKRSFGVNPAEIKQRWIDEELMARGWGWGLGGRVGPLGEGL